MNACCSLKSGHTRKLIFGFQYAFGLKSRIDPVQRPEASNQQRGAADEYDCERQLGDDQHASNTASHRPGRRPPGAVGERRMQVQTPSLHRGQQGEGEADENRYSERREQDAPVDRGERQAGNVRRRNGNEESHADIRAESSGHGTSHRKQERLRERVTKKS